MSDQRAAMETAHVLALDSIETQLKAARGEALTLGLGSGAIDRALLALGSRDERGHDDAPVRKALDLLHVVRRCGVPAVGEAALMRAMQALESALR